MKWNRCFAFLAGAVLSAAPALAQNPVRLVDPNGDGEDWNTAADWEDGALPVAGKEYVVENNGGAVLRSPSAASPRFAGDSLGFVGSGATLELRHTGIATIPRLVFEGGGLAAARSAGLAGGVLQVEDVPEGSQWRVDPGAVLEIRHALSGTGEIELVGAESADRPPAELRLTGSGSDFTGTWVVQDALLRPVTPGSAGRSTIVLVRGQLDFDYNYSAPEAVLAIDGEGFLLHLDQEIVIGGLVGLVDGEILFQLPPGAYTAEDLIDIGFAPEQVQGEGRVVVLDATLDADGDGLLDEWEETAFGGLGENAAGDADGDGLGNEGEFMAGTNPRDGDTDGDGLEDGAESGSGFFVDAANAGSHPFRPDTDGDGLTDGEEVKTTGSDPNRADTDGDRLGDREEVQVHGTNPALADSDGDGLDDRLEILAGSDPNDPESVFDLVDLAVTGFEEPPAGSSSYFSTGNEVGWDIAVGAGAPQTVDSLEGVPLPSRQLLMHNAAMTWRSAPVQMVGFSEITVEAEARVFQTSSGIEPDDFIDLGVEWSLDGGQTYAGQALFLSVEGTRTGVSGGPRTPLEAVLDVTAPVDGPFVRFGSEVGAIPNNATHLRVFIAASNNSASERFLFDNVRVRGIARIDLEADTDGDGMPDLFEVQNGLDPEDAADKNGDADGDGLTNFEEYELGTGVRVVDTDGDVLDDGDEVGLQGTDPLKADTDGDTLADGAEVNTHGTDPLKADTDGDGFDDATELAFGSDPNVVDESLPVGPPGSLGYIGFLQSPPGATELVANGVELGWSATATGTGRGVIEALDGVPLPDRQFYIHNGSLRLVTDPVAVPNPAATVVRVDARVYQTSTGIELEDFIDIKVELSADGVTFDGELVLLQIEGTRTGASGGPRTPLEDVLVFDTAEAPADGPFVTFSTAPGAIPPQATHVRIVIEAQNNSASERFVFDNLLVQEVEVIDPALDSDGDGMPDAYEVANGLDRFSAADAAQDADGDGLTNLREYQAGTLVQSADTDADGLNDGPEIDTAGSDPLDPDTDGDRLQDGFEVNGAGTSAILADSDGDGLDDRQELVFETDPLTANGPGEAGPEGAAAFTWFEQPGPGARSYAYAGIEMGWVAAGDADALGVAEELDGALLPDQPLLLHNGAMTFVSDIVAIDDPGSAVVTVAARVYQTSTGIELEDFIDMKILTSADGVRFDGEILFAALEGTRTGASGGPRSPMEDVLDVNGTVNGPFSVFASELGAIPEGTTHIRIVIEAANDSPSERFLFDRIAVLGTTGSVVIPPRAPVITTVEHDAGEGLRLEWLAEPGGRYRVEYRERLGTGPWEILETRDAAGGTMEYTHPAAVALPEGYYRVVRE